MSVTANAGSGKTLVLVERYVGLLTSGAASVGEIVAITFTEKAASELKRKIADRMAETMEVAERPDERGRLASLRAQISSAVIGTIHGFCSRLLREYPVEAGVDASFTVIEEIDRRMMVQDVLQEVFRDVLLHSEDPILKDSLKYAVRQLGKHRLQRILLALIEKRDQVGRLIDAGGLYSLSDETILTFWFTRLRDILDAELNAPSTHDLLRDILGAADGADADAMRSLFHQFMAEKERRTALLPELMRGLFTKAGNLRRTVVTRAAETAPLRIQSNTLFDLYGRLRLLVSLADIEATRARHEKLLGISRCLLELQQRALELLERRKVELAALDFEDLQIRAKLLLSREDIRRQLASRFKYIMVDEFQDTNRLQYEVLVPLVTGMRSGNLFIVGDPKQSIYGFRDADVRVFNRTRDEIRQTVGAEGEVVLGESFRLLRYPAAFVNLVFSGLMSSSRSAGSEPVAAARYDQLVVARGNTAPGRVELIVRDAVTAPREETIPEGELIASRILSLRASGHLVYDKDESARPVMFRDVAVLVRNRTPLPEIEDALSRHGIPFVVTGGIGFFQTQDVLDFYNYFRFLLNPQDDVALAGILRSPLFGVSDAELFEVEADQRNGSLWEHLVSDVHPAGEFSSLVFAVETLKDDLLVAQRLSVPELIHRIVRQTAYRGKMAGTSRGVQSQANLEKLVDLAQRFTVRGLSTLFDFTRRLRYLIEEEEQEGQGAIDVQADAVQLMTVHAAKGLEFPVVVLPSLERPFRPEDEPFIDEELGLGFGFREEDRELRSPVTGWLKQLSRARIVEEEKRILYVACTRARDMLILSGLRKGKRSAVHCLNWILDGLGLGDTIPSGILEFSLTAGFGSDDMDRQVEASRQFAVHILRPDQLPLVHAGPMEVAKTTVAPKLFVQSLSSSPRGEVFSASKIRLFLNCPAKYYLKYVIGMPAGSDLPRTQDDEESADETSRADVRGRVFHRVMESVDRLETGEVSLDELIGYALRAEGDVPDAKALVVAGKIRRMVSEVINSDFWQTVHSAVETHVELSLTGTLDEDFITGKIDRLYKDRDGLWNVLDYKTDVVDAGMLTSRAREYEPQLKLYGLLVARLKQAQTVRVQALFTSDTRRPFLQTYDTRDFAAFQEELRGIARQIKTGRILVPETPCSDCPFLPSGCRAILNNTL